MALSNESICIIKDLTEKYPAGPRGSLKKHHYEEITRWVTTYGRETKVVHIRDEVGPGIVAQDRKTFFGYDPVVLHKTRLRSEDDCIQAMRSVEPAASPMSRKRDGRRLWIRLESAIDWIKQNGTEGIWHAYWRNFEYGHPLSEGIRLYARERSEAESRVSHISPMLGVPENVRPTIKFVDIGTPEKAMEFNSSHLQALVRRPESSIKDLEKRLESARKQLEDAKQLSTKIVSAIMMMNFDESQSDTDEEEVP
jgi:hypothetical protein